MSRVLEAGLGSGVVEAAGASRSVNGVALTVVIILFVLVAALGFFAARWRAGKETGCTAWTSGASAAAVSGPG